MGLAMPADVPGLLVEQRNNIAILTLDRPTRGNSLTPSMHDGMRSAWAWIRSDPSVRVVIITATGERHFSTGTDVTEVAASGRTNAGDAPLKEAIFWTARQNNVWKPTICAVNGMVAGGGLHFVVDSDIVVASEGATFLDTHVNVGMVGAIENIGLVQRLPLGTALRMTLQGKAFRLSAERAYQLGLIDELVPSDQSVLESAMRIAEDICKVSPEAAARSLEAIWGSLGTPYDQALENGWTLVRNHWTHPDFVEGPRAFVESRPPHWGGPGGSDG